MVAEAPAFDKAHLSEHHGYAPERANAFTEAEAIYHHLLDHQTLGRDSTHWHNPWDLAVIPVPTTRREWARYKLTRGAAS